MLNTGPYVFTNFTYRHGIMVVSKPCAYKPQTNGRDGGPGGKLIRKNITVRMPDNKFIRKLEEGNALSLLVSLCHYVTSGVGGCPCMCI